MEVFVGVGDEGLKVVRKNKDIESECVRVDIKNSLTSDRYWPTSIDVRSLLGRRLLTSNWY